MYKLLCLFLFAGLCNSLLAQQWKAGFESLVSDKKYLTAYEWLNSLDDSLDVELQLAKINLAIDYYAVSRYHRYFGFADLRAGESLDEIRTNGEVDRVKCYLPVDSILLRLKERHPDDYRIHHQLGKYYNAVFLLFGDRWGKSSEWLLDQGQHYFSEAWKHGVYDYYSLYAMGYYNTLIENYHEARYWYHKSLQIKDDPLTNYNLAVACLFDGMFSEGISSAQRACELFSDSLKKSDAARITGILYSKTGKNKDALNYFIKADKLSPGYKPNQLYLLKSYLSLKYDDKVTLLADEVLMQNIYSPDLFQELLDMFEQEERLAMLHDIFNIAQEKSRNDAEAMGNILFHFAKLEYKLGHKKRARRYLKKSKSYFQDVFEEGHQVFQAIDQTLEQL